MSNRRSDQETLVSVIGDGGPGPTLELREDSVEQEVRQRVHHSQEEGVDGWDQVWS